MTLFKLLLIPSHLIHPFPSVSGDRKIKKVKWNLAITLEISTCRAPIESFMYNFIIENKVIHSTSVENELYVTCYICKIFNGFKIPFKPWIIPWLSFNCFSPPLEKIWSFSFEISSCTISYLLLAYQCKYLLWLFSSFHVECCSGSSKTFNKKRFGLNRSGFKFPCCMTSVDFLGSGNLHSSVKRTQRRIC